MFSFTRRKGREEVKIKESERTLKTTRRISDYESDKALVRNTRAGTEYKGDKRKRRVASERTIKVI